MGGWDTYPLWMNTKVLKYETGDCRRIFLPNSFIHYDDGVRKNICMCFRYKEGRVILEKALIKEMEGFEENQDNTTSH